MTIYSLIILKKEQLVYIVCLGVYITIDDWWRYDVHIYDITKNLFHMTIIQFLCLLLELCALKKQSKQIKILSTIREQRERVWDGIIKWIISIERCCNIICIGPRAFVNLFALLRDHCNLQPI